MRTCKYILLILSLILILSLHNIKEKFNDVIPIPKIINQTWKTHELPENFKKWNDYNQREYFSNPFLNKKQKTFKITLEDIDDILNQNNIEYTLSCGTALGAYREHKFIEHDHDIDLRINKNLEKISKIITDSNKFTLARFLPKDEPLRNASEITLKHKKTGINVDIFKVIKKNNKYIIYTYGSICNTKPNRRCEFENSIYKIVNINFMGRIYKIPEFKYIIESYGKDWNTPKKYSYDEGLKSEYKNIVK